MAQIKVGFMKLHGQVCNRNAAEAVKYFTMAADQVKFAPFSCMRMHSALFASCLECTEMLQTRPSCTGRHAAVVRKRL